MAPVELSNAQNIAAALFGIVVLGVLAGSIGCWALLIYSRLSGLKLGLWRTQPTVPTVGLLDLLLVLVCVVLLQGFVLSVFRLASPPPSAALSSGSGFADAKPDEVTSSGEVSNAIAKESKPPKERFSALSITLGCIILLVAAGMAAVVTVTRLGLTFESIGIRGDQLFKDVQIGVGAFLICAPVILTVSQIVSLATDVKYVHPVIDAMRENAGVFPALFLSAAVVAPIWEEFAFRGLLIQWFDTMRNSRWNLATIILGRRRERTDMPHDETTEPFQQIRVADTNPYSPGEIRSWWPAILSGTFFGLAHFEYGVSWIPLIVFGVVLGRVYQMRRSVIPCIIAHGLFNSLSMFALATSMFVTKPN